MGVITQKKREPQLKCCINVKTSDINGGLMTLFVLKRDRVVLVINQKLQGH